MTATKNTKKTLDEREELLVEVEKLMLEGIQNASFIAKQIKVSLPTAQSYRQAVLARWRAMDKDGLKMFIETRLELIEKSKLVESRLWETYKKSTNESAALGTLRTILDVHRFQAWLTGISKAMGKDDKN